MQRIRLSSLPPDLRFGSADAIADPEAFPALAHMSVHVTGCLSASPAAPAYLRYSDRDAELLVIGIGEPVDVERELAERIHALGECEVLDDLSAAVVVLDVVDRCFRDAGLWRGNVYLAGGAALTAVLEIAGAGFRREPATVVRELAALELAYLFPVAGKFRSGTYDGQVQYRLNGWGRALAARLSAGPVGVARAGEWREMLGRHLAEERERYASFLRELDVAQQDYRGDILDRAMELPIPVLV